MHHHGKPLPDHGFDGKIVAIGLKTLVLRHRFQPAQQESGIRAQDFSTVFPCTFAGAEIACSLDRYRKAIWAKYAEGTDVVFLDFVLALLLGRAEHGSRAANTAVVLDVLIR